MVSGDAAGIKLIHAEEVRFHIVSFTAETSLRTVRRSV